MLSVKASKSRFSLHLLLIALFFTLFSPDVAMGQSDLGMMMDYPPWAGDDSEWTIYNVAIQIDVLMNDFDGSNPIDPSTVTIVKGPTSGTAEVDPVLGIVLYTPDSNFVGADQFEYTVADTAGNVSNIATVDVWVDNMPPEITLNYYEDVDDMWVFYGTVTDENPGTCIVSFGGLLDGKTALVNKDGSYVLYVLLTNGEEGEVTAQTTDEVGEASNIAQVYVTRY
jgi:hypothetical protein